MAFWRLFLEDFFVTRCKFLHPEKDRFLSQRLALEMCVSLCLKYLEFYFVYLKILEFKNPSLIKFQVTWNFVFQKKYRSNTKFSLSPSSDNNCNCLFLSWKKKNFFYNPIRHWPIIWICVWFLQGLYCRVKLAHTWGGRDNTKLILGCCMSQENLSTVFALLCMWDKLPLEVGVL